MWSCRGAPRSPRRPVCGACARWRRRASSRAITPISTASRSAIEVTGFAFVGLASQAEADLKHFEEQVRAWPQVRECLMLSGEVDFLLKCVARESLRVPVLHHRHADGREERGQRKDCAGDPFEQTRTGRAGGCEVAGRRNRPGGVAEKKKAPRRHGEHGEQEKVPRANARKVFFSELSVSSW